MGIRIFTGDDAAAVCAIQLKCPQAAQWRREDYLELSRDPSATILLAEIEAIAPIAVAGFAVFCRATEEAELRNIAVDPSWRRKGLARALLATGILAMQGCGVRELFLEVRASNQAAIALYTSMDFRALYTRHGYYHDPVDDALVMARSIVPAPGSPVERARQPQPDPAKRLSSVHETPEQTMLN